MDCPAARDKNKFPGLGSQTSGNEKSCTDVERKAVSCCQSIAGMVSKGSSNGIFCTALDCSAKRLQAIRASVGHQGSGRGIGSRDMAGQRMGCRIDRDTAVADPWISCVFRRFTLVHRQRYPAERNAGLGHP